MKKGLLSILVIFFALSMILAACGSSGSSGSSGSDSSGSSSGSSPSGGGSGKVIELKVSHFLSPQHIQHTDVFEPFAKEVEERTNGRIKVTIYPGAALGAPTSQYQLATTGVADISYALQSYTPGKFPLSSVVDLPNLSKNGHVGSQILWGLYEKFPEVQAEYSENKVMWLFTNDPDQILLANKEVRSVADLKGLKISTPSQASNAVVEAWGATPVFMPMNEVYEAMQKGVIDGRMGPLSALKDFRLFEVTKYVVEGNFYTTNFAVTMNKDKWESLSPEDQAILQELFDKYRQIASVKYDESAVEGRKLAEDAGVVFMQATDEFKEPLNKIHDQWLKDNPNGAEVHAEALRLSAELN